jgi:hypothetical protein
VRERGHRKTKDLLVGGDLFEIGRVEDPLLLLLPVIILGGDHPLRRLDEHISFPKNALKTWKLKMLELIWVVTHY